MSCGKRPTEATDLAIGRKKARDTVQNESSNIQRAVQPFQQLPLHGRDIQLTSNDSATDSSRFSASLLALQQHMMLQHQLDATTGSNFGVAVPHMPHATRNETNSILDQLIKQRSSDINSTLANGMLVALFRHQQQPDSYFVSPSPLNLLPHSFQQSTAHASIGDYNYASMLKNHFMDLQRPPVQQRSTEWLQHQLSALGHVSSLPAYAFPPTSLVSQDQFQRVPRQLLSSQSLSHSTEVLTQMLLQERTNALLASHLTTASFEQSGHKHDSLTRPSEHLILALACDEEHLSEYQTLLRKQLEYFEADQQDEQSNVQGRKRPVYSGQVGIRCVHCAHIPLRQRSRGAVYYPAKLTGVYQAAQNMASSHLCSSCEVIPADLKTKLCKLRDQKGTAGGGKQYWADGCRAMGLCETTDGIRMTMKAHGNNLAGLG